MAKLIEIKKLSYNNIFNNFSISFPIKKLIYLSGPNNCGKTTLIRTLDRENDSKFTIFIPYFICYLTTILCNILCKN